MSLVIAIKDKNRFVLGADCQTSAGSFKDHTATKIWDVDSIPNAIMGGVGSMRANQIIQYSDVIDKNDWVDFGPTTEFIIKSLVPAIVTLLEANGVSCEAREDPDSDKLRFLPNSFIFAFEDKAWVIWTDLSVIEIDSYYAIGSASDVANGALYATPKLDPFSRIVTSISAAADSTLYVDNDINLLVTDYYASDKTLIKKAFNNHELFDDEVEQVTEKKSVTTKKSKTGKSVSKS